MSIEQSGNAVTNGDIVAGNQTNQTIHQYAAKGTNREIQGLYERLKKGESGDSNSAFCADLEHYMSLQPEIDVRGLDAKLVESNRTDLLFLAKQMKEKAAKAIMRRQTSRTAQRIFVIILDQIHYDFIMKVTPLIEEDSPRKVVDEKIGSIIDDLYSSLGENLLELTAKDLLGLLFFLGGNCHIRWDKC
ncbi:ABC-three component system protein [Rahnella sp. AN3-3W3]|uniref:ABC-three component system protein n=1 Tax=Rahnella sp. AN3-3W3 TaxID=1610578 RepID=UPI000DD33C8C|nr:ABC-three component system protein [Rahnella sp. AN3-3W3]